VRSGRWILLGAALAAVSCRERAPASVDTDRDGFAAGIDCNDADPAVHATVTAYPDADGDGVGSGTTSSFCTDGTVPAGHALQEGDCAPADPAAWRLVDLVDRDGDGYTAKESTPLCAGATLPDPYRPAAQGNDCADADPALFRWVVLYRDQDGDGVGARPRSIPCLGTAIPAGWSRLGYDVDDLDPSVASDPTEDDLALLLD
jgi:hypothetical protein